MAIEIPNVLVAGGVCDQARLPDDPVLSARGLQAYNPATNGANPALSLGGFTKVDVGSYLLKTTEGQDPAEAAFVATPARSDTAFSGAPIGYASGAPGTYGDGHSLITQFEDIETNEARDVGFWFLVVRFATGPRLTPETP